MPVILVVDTDSVTLDLAERTLGAAGFGVRTAGSAEAALDLLAAEPFDLVLLEILLPRKEGIETILEMRRRWPLMPVLAMSGGGLVVTWRETLPLAKALGAHATLAKPFSPEELLHLVLSALAVGVDG